MTAIPPNHLASRHCTTLHSLPQKMFLNFFPTPLLFLLLCSLSGILADNDADPTRSTMEQFSGYPTQEPDSVSSFSVDTVSSFSVDAQGLQKQVWRENFKDCNLLGGLIMWVSVFFCFLGYLELGIGREIGNNCYSWYVDWLLLSVIAFGAVKWVFMGPFNGPHKLYFTINWEWNRWFLDSI